MLESSSPLAPGQTSPGHRRKHRTEAERSEILRRWAESGLRGAAFAAQCGVSYASLLQWRKRLAGHSAGQRIAGVAPPSRVMFLEADVAPMQQGQFLRLDLPRWQASVQIDSIHGVHIAVHLLRALSAPCSVSPEA